MKELVEVIAKSLVDHPEEVVVTEKEDGENLILELKVASQDMGVVTEKEDGENLILELKVASQDMGKVIGRQGRIAKAIRSVVKAASTKTDKKVTVEIIQ